MKHPKKLRSSFLGETKQSDQFLKNMKCIWNWKQTVMIRSMFDSFLWNEWKGRKKFNNKNCDTISEPGIIEYGIPHLKYYTYYEGYKVIVMTKLGRNLEKLLSKSDNKFSKRIVFHIAIQCVSTQIFVLFCSISRVYATLNSVQICDSQLSNRYGSL